MVRNLVVQIAGPAVSKVQRHFLAQPALMTNTMSIRIIGSGSTEGRPISL